MNVQFRGGLLPEEKNDVTVTRPAAGDGEAEDSTMEMADRAEAESIRRFRQLRELRNAIDEAARRAEAGVRLEHALRYARDARP